MAIQEQLSGFIVEQVIDPKGEFYYDGKSHIDNRCNIYVIKIEYTYINYMCVYVLYFYL